MSRPARKSKLDRFSISLAVTGLVLFLIAALCYLLSLYLFLTPPSEQPPEFTLTEIGNVAGLAGMVVIPFFILTASIQIYRESKDDKKPRHDEDLETEHGTAGSS